MLIPSFEGGDSLRVQAAVRHLIADLSFAQSDALAHQEYRRVHFYDDGHGYCITRIATVAPVPTFDPDTADYIIDPISDPGEDGRYIVDFTVVDKFEGVTVSAIDIDSGGRDIIYDRLGGTVRSGEYPGIGGTIVLTAEGENYQVTVSPFTGKLTVQRLDG
jgi:hypothetical protein